MSRRLLHRLIAAACVAHGSCAVLHAQVADTARIAPVVVTATRSPLPLDRVPASITVLDGARLRAQGITTLADALRLAPGVAIVQAGSYGAQTSLFVRGGQRNYTKILVDGIPVNDPGGDIDLGTIALDNIERIEFVRGPSSVLYGSDAVTGVVQIVTRQAPQRAAARLDARGGTYGSYDVIGDANATLAGARLDVGGAHHETNGIYEFNSAYRNDVGTGTLMASPWHAADLRATARYSDATAHYPTNFAGRPVDPNAYRTEKRMLLGAELTQRIARADARFALTSNLGDGAIIDPANDASDVGSTTRNHVRRQGAELRVSLPIQSVLDLSFGGQLEHQHGAEDRHNAGAFAQLLASASSTTGVAGVRVDRSATYGSFATYRLAITHLFPSATRLRGSLGTAFREPSFSEAFATDFSVANPDLRPEHTTSWEVAVEQSIWSDALVVGATYFHQRFVDLIDYHFDPAGASYENIARARSAGAELELRTAPRRNITLDASYTFLDTKVLERGFSTSPLASLRKDGPLLRRPKHSATLGLGYQRPAGGAVALRTTYVGHREDRLFQDVPPFNTDAVRLAPYTKVDFSAELPIVTRPQSALSATLRIDNLFATTYESVAGYATPGRVLLVGVRIGR
jgi:vitamin B12 transporter